LKTNVAVVGLGKIGLPLAVAIAASDKIGRVFGIDVDETVVSGVNAGIAHIYGEPHLQDLLDSAHKLNKLSATTSFKEGLAEADIVLVAVPLYTNIEKAPDFSIIDSAVSSISTNLREGTLIIFETTLPIGTTANRFAPTLEKLSGLSLASGSLLVAFSPERVSTGSFFADIKAYPKIVGGVNNSSTEAAMKFYRSWIDFDALTHDGKANGVWRVSNADAAEFVKLAETTYRDVNIALANVFQLHANQIGVSFEQIRLAANSQPYSHIHMPGISVGGHCIPVYPNLYLNTHDSAEIVRVARATNDSMPNRAVDILKREIGDLAGLNVLVLGIAYRPGVKEDAFSGAHALKTILQASGVNVFASDPLYSDDELHRLGFRPVSDADSIDAVVLHTAHEQFENLSLRAFPNAKYFVDGRGVLDSANFPGVFFESLVN
jgi:nucleotide sugar dehydrogenase